MKRTLPCLLEIQMEGTGPGVTPKRDSPFKKHPAT